MKKNPFLVQGNTETPLSSPEVVDWENASPAQKAGLKSHDPGFIKEGGSSYSMGYFYQVKKTEAVIDQIIHFVEKNGKKGLIDSKGREIVAPQYDYIYSKNDGLYKVEKNGKKGFIRPDGTVFVAVKYDYIYSEKDGVYKVELNNKKGFVDAKTGQELCPPKYDYIYSKHDGLYKVELNGKKGFIDSNFKEIVPPTYDYIYSFSGGLAKVERGDKVGYINKQGKLIQPLE